MSKRVAANAPFCDSAIPNRLRGVSGFPAGVQSSFCSLPRRDAPNRAGAHPEAGVETFREPEITIGTAGNTSGTATFRAGRKSELRDAARGRNTSDAPPIGLSEPEIAVRSAGDTFGTAAQPIAATVGGERKLLNAARGRNASGAVSIGISEPEVAIRARGDATRSVCEVREWKLGDPSRWGDAPNLAAAAPKPA